jgi:hypothetical protein
VANSRQFSKKNDAAKPVNDPFIYPKGGLYSTRQYLEFWDQQTQQPQGQDDICSKFTASINPRK